MSANDILMSRHPITCHAAGVYTAGAQGNSLVVDLGETLLIERDGGRKLLAAVRQIDAALVRC